MSISRHVDEYMALRGITPDDTVVSGDPCAIFDGRVVDSAEDYRAAGDQHPNVDAVEDLLRGMLKK